jgi:coenzyme PQQ synthesis protein D (PqqD)
VKDQYISRAYKIAARMLGNEMVIMSAVDSTIFSLNEVATVIWEAADGATPLRRIIEEKVCPEFDVNPREAMADAEKFVADLAACGILQLSDAPMNPGVEA